MLWWVVASGTLPNKCASVGQRGYIVGILEQQLLLSCSTLIQSSCCWFF